MFFRNSTGNRECHISGSVYGGRKACGHDSGLPGSQYHPFWDVYVIGQSTGGGGYSGSTGSIDTPALYVGAGRNLDSYEANRTGGRKALSDQ